MAMSRCPVCDEYMLNLFGDHRCGPSYQTVIIGNDDPPSAPFEIREQLSVRKSNQVQPIQQEHTP